MLSAIISSRKDSYQCSSSESLEPIHHAFMGSDDHVEVVLGKEALHTVRPEFNYITCF